MVGKPFLPADRALATLDNRAGSDQGLKHRDYFGAHAIGTGGEELDYGDFAIAIDDCAGKPVTVAVDQAIAIGVRGNDAGTEFEGAAKPIIDYFTGRGRCAEGEQPDRDRSIGITIADAKQVTTGVVDLHHIARRQRGWFDAC